MENWLIRFMMEFIAGIGIFLFAMKSLGDGLQKTAGEHLKNWLDTCTRNPILGVFMGFVVTVCIQSSSATTVITVGLVSSGLLSLRNAIGIIMGANIGTTVTAFIIGVPIQEYAFVFLGIGSILLVVRSNKQSLGQIIFGFGGLFVGLNWMKEAMKPLKSLDFFTTFMVQMSDDPILSLLVGILLTGLIQSSSAAIGILQNLYTEGIISLQGAIPILLGDNIGTTVTVILAAVGSGIAALRTAAVHVMFNLIGAILFLIVLPLFTYLISSLEAFYDISPAFTIAIAHGLFNFINMCVHLPFIQTIEKTVIKLFPSDRSSSLTSFDPMIRKQSPSIALNQASRAIQEMSQLVLNACLEVFVYFRKPKHQNIKVIFEIEKKIDALEKQIHEFLVSIPSSQLSKRASLQYFSYLAVIKDFERMSDHLVNIAELLQKQHFTCQFMTNKTLYELENMFCLTYETLQLAMQSFFEHNHSLANKVFENEKEIDLLERKLRKEQIQKLQNGSYKAIAGVSYIDFVRNLERIGDHAVNIAELVLQESKSYEVVQPPNR